MSTKHRTIRSSPRGNRFDAILLSELSKCPFYKKQCNHCEIPSLPMRSPKENHDALVEDIMRLDGRETVKQANVFGTGNVLNPNEITNETFAFAIGYLPRSFPNLECLGVDTRPEIALSKAGRARIAQALQAVSTIRFELIIGYETQDIELRTSATGLNKRITEQHMQDVFQLAKELGLGLQINVMLMPLPTMTLRAAIDEAVLTIQHIAEMQAKFNVYVLINLNPLYINHAMLEKLGNSVLEVETPSFAHIAEVISCVGHLLPVFVGLDDDGLAVKKGY